MAAGVTILTVLLVPLLLLKWAMVVENRCVVSKKHDISTVTEK